MNPIDLFPGGRTAYNYVLGKLAEFYVIGRQRVPSWTAGVARIDGEAKKRGLTTLSEQSADVKADVASLGGQ